MNCGVGYAGDLPAGRPFAAYFEAHIEQGPILEDTKNTIGVVTGALGLRWYDVVVTGQDAHAGPTPMHLQGLDAGRVTHRARTKPYRARTRRHSRFQAGQAKFQKRSSGEVRLSVDDATRICVTPPLAFAASPD